MSQTRLLVGACIALFGALTLIAFMPAGRAAEGRIPIPSTPPPYPPLTASGKYILTRNLGGSALGPILTISGSDVDLDLNGFTLDQTSSSLAVIQVDSTASGNIAIRNGILKGGTHGIWVQTAGKVVIEDVQISGTLGGSPLGAAIRIGNVADNFVVRRVVVGSVQGEGILVESNATSRQGTIADCQIRAGRSGISINDGVGVGIVGNRFVAPTSSNLWSAIDMSECSGCRVEGNTSVGGYNGIFVGQDSDGIQVVDNTVRDAGERGILVAADDCGIRGNVATASGDNPGNRPGILVTGQRNFIEGNVSNNNYGYGLEFAPGACRSFYSRNLLDGNGGTGCVGTGGTNNLCDAGNCNKTIVDNMVGGGPQ